MVYVGSGVARAAQSESASKLLTTLLPCNHRRVHQEQVHFAHRSQCVDYAELARRHGANTKHADALGEQRLESAPREIFEQPRQLLGPTRERNQRLHLAPQRGLPRLVGR